MRITKPLATFVLSSPLLFGGMGEAQTIEHGEFGPGSQVQEGTSQLCKGLPEGTDFIPNLTTGWAVKQAEGGVRLIFSDVSLACADDADLGLTELTREQCIDGWSYSLLLPPEILEVGLHDLADYTVAFRQQDVKADSGFGCGDQCGVIGTGSGTGPGIKLQAQLEIFSVSDECITGRVIGLETGQIQPPPPELNGGFHAVLCDGE